MPGILHRKRKKPSPEARKWFKAVKKSPQLKKLTEKEELKYAFASKWDEFKGKVEGLEELEKVVKPEEREFYAEMIEELGLKKVEGGISGRIGICAEWLKKKAGVAAFDWWFNVVEEASMFEETKKNDALKALTDPRLMKEEQISFIKRIGHFKAYEWLRAIAKTGDVEKHTKKEIKDLIEKSASVAKVRKLLSEIS